MNNKIHESIFVGVGGEEKYMKISVCAVAL